MIKLTILHLKTSDCFGLANELFFIAAPTQIRTPLRRTERKSLPNSALMIRRQIIQKNLKTPDSMKRRQKNVKIKKNIDRKLKVQKRIKFENNNTDDVESMQKPALNACDSSPKTDVKHESDDDERLDLPENFSKLIHKFNHYKSHSMTKHLLIDIEFHWNCVVVTKATGITPDITRDIQPTYFPSEDENSGVIVFKSNSRRAVLNISFAKVSFLKCEYKNNAFYAIYMCLLNFHLNSAVFCYFEWNIQY